LQAPASKLGAGKAVCDRGGRCQQRENRRKYDVVNLKIVEELFPAEPKIEHIHLDKGHYWISLGNGRNREFFMRIRPSAGP
jgi:hypothetical protein